LPRWDPVDLARTIELARGDLGADFATAWEAGTRLTEDEALALAAGSLEWRVVDLVDGMPRASGRNYEEGVAFSPFVH
jgi:hypothetical protein